MNQSMKTLYPVLVLAALVLPACGGGGGSMTASNQTTPEQMETSDPGSAMPDDGSDTTMPNPGSNPAPGASPGTTPSLPGTAARLALLMETEAGLGLEAGRDQGFGFQGEADYSLMITFAYPGKILIGGQPSAWSESDGLYRRTTDTHDEIAFIKTDIASATTRKLLDVYPLDVRFNMDGGPQDTIDVSCTADCVGGARERPVFEAAYGRNTESVQGTSFSKGENFTGMLGEASGTYRCLEETGCTVEIDSESDLVERLVGWVFLPDDPDSATVKVLEDSDYYYYGVWAELDNNIEGLYTRVSSFAGSSTVETDPGVLSGLAGSFTYTGEAAGLYQRGDEFGTFTGSVSLTANFSTDRISGEVTGLSGNVSDWTVMLQATGIDETRNRFVGRTQDGGWSGQFRGFAAEVAVGEFDVRFTDGDDEDRLLGGFGTRKQ